MVQCLWHKIECQFPSLQYSFHGKWRSPTQKQSAQRNLTFTPSRASVQLLSLDLYSTRGPTILFPHLCSTSVLKMYALLGSIYLIL